MPGVECVPGSTSRSRSLSRVGFTVCVEFVNVEKSESTVNPLPPPPQRHGRNFTLMHIPDPETPAGTAHSRHSKSIMLLVHIRDAYSEPRFQIHADPWDLLVSNRMVIEGTAKSPMVIKSAVKEASELGILLSHGHFINSKCASTALPQLTPAVPDGLPNSATSRLLPDVIYGTAVTSKHACPPGFTASWVPRSFAFFILFPGRQRDLARGYFSRALGTRHRLSRLSRTNGDSENQGQRYTVKTEAGQLIIREYSHNALRRLRGNKPGGALDRRNMHQPGG